MSLAFTVEAFLCGFLDRRRMNRKAILTLAAGLAIATIRCLAQTAQEATPQAAPAPDYKLLISMAKCSDMTCLDSYREQVGNHKLAKIVFYEKWLLLEHAKAAAEGLLRNLPQTETEESQLMTLRDWHDDSTKSNEELTALADIYEKWPESIADGVLVFPQFLPAYIRYGLLARNDIHSDYTGNEERVCHADPPSFQAAFYRLDRKSQSELRKFVFNPEKCRAIFFSEGD
jgi:hypothetical protein